MRYQEEKAEKTIHRNHEDCSVFFATRWLITTASSRTPRAPRTRWCGAVAPKVFTTRVISIPAAKDRHWILNRFEKGLGYSISNGSYQIWFLWDAITDFRVELYDWNCLDTYLSSPCFLFLYGMFCCHVSHCCTECLQTFNTEPKCTVIKNCCIMLAYVGI